MADDETKWSAQRLFDNRMRREGLFDEFTKECKRVRIEEGLTFMPAKRVAMDKFGFVSKDEELRLLALHKRQVALGRVHVEDIEHEEEVAETTEGDLYEKYFRRLPDTAETKVEIDWVRSHEAMTRKARDPDLDSVTLTAKDIEKAPSKSAVIMLQNWANNPNEFFKRLLDEHKKKTVDQADKEEAVREEEDDMQEAIDLLRSLQ